MYVIWQSATQWHLSRVDGRTDQHTRQSSMVSLQQYCDANGLPYTIYPLDKVVNKKCVDTWEYWKIAA